MPLPFVSVFFFLSLFVVSLHRLTANIHDGISFGERFTIHIFYINLDGSTRRESEMSEMLSERNLGVNSSRIRASTVEDVKAYRKSGRLHLAETSVIQSKRGKSYSWRRRELCEFTIKEVASSLSHFRALEAAYESGYKTVVVLEDDVMLSMNFIEDLKIAIEAAPSDWEILQLNTINPNIIAHLANNVDAYVSWMPEHWGTGGYVVNRRGASKFINSHRIKSHNGDVNENRNRNRNSMDDSNETSWNIPEKCMILADELLYASLNAYTYTDSSLVTLGNSSCHSTLDIDYQVDCKDRTKEKSDIQTMVEQKKKMNIQKIIPGSLLVIKSALIANVSKIDESLDSLLRDMKFLSQLQFRVEWRVTLCIPESLFIAQIILDKLAPLRKYGKATLMKLKGATYNKWTTIYPHRKEMDSFDRVLYMDFDMHLAGMPFKTFVKQCASTLICSTLRQSIEQWTYSNKHNKNYVSSHFQLHEAGFYKLLFQREEVKSIYTEIRPLYVPFLEQSFFYMDGAFAKSFFENFLDWKYVSQPSDWGPDYAYCGAAHAWGVATKQHFNRQVCALIPVVLRHDDTKSLQNSAAKNAASRKYLKTLAAKNESYYNFTLFSEFYRQRYGGEPDLFLRECHKFVTKGIEAQLYSPKRLQHRNTHGQQGRGADRGRKRRRYVKKRIN